MKKFLINIINIYQKIPLKSHYNCKFIPTCSEYTKEAIVKYGALKGLFLGFLRIIKCNPFHKSKYDPLK